MVEPHRPESHPLFYLDQAFALIGKPILPAALEQHAATLFGRAVSIQFERGLRQDEALAAAVAEFEARVEQFSSGAHRPPELVTKWPAPQGEPVPAKLLEMKERQAKVNKLKAAEDRRIAKTKLANGRKRQEGGVP